MKFERTILKDCFIITPKIFEDERGYFFESFSQKVFNENTGLDISFVQDNQSKSSKGVLRGLHYQKGDFAQSKLVRVTQGAVLDVCVDIRKESETFGLYVAVVLDAISHKQLFIPRGFAHGFAVLEDDTVFTYKCDNYYHKASEGGIHYLDEDLAIDWKLSMDDIIVSEKDQKLPSFRTLL